MDNFLENGDLNAPAPDFKSIVKAQSGVPAAAPGKSRHESGFAFDVNWRALTPEQRARLKEIAASHGFVNRPDINDGLHFEADPLRHGYSSRTDAVNENNRSFKEIGAKKEAEAAVGELLIRLLILPNQ